MEAEEEIGLLREFYGATSDGAIEREEKRWWALKGRGREKGKKPSRSGDGRISFARLRWVLGVICLVGIYEICVSLKHYRKHRDAFTAGQEHRVGFHSMAKAASTAMQIHAGVLRVMKTGERKAENDVKSNSGIRFIDARIRGANPQVADSYCIESVPVPGDVIQGGELYAYAVKFDPLIDDTQRLPPHHMMLHGCKNEAVHVPDNELCMEQEMGMARCDEGRILYVWAHRGGTFQLPSGVGIKLGGKDGIKSFSLVMHYKYAKAPGIFDHSGFRVHVSHSKRELRELEVQVYVPPSYVVPPGMQSFSVSSTECYQTGRIDQVFRVFAFRVHAHALGVKNELKVYRSKAGNAIRSRDGTCTTGNEHKFEVFRVERSTQLPQSFVSLPQWGQIGELDTVSFACVYNSEKQVETVKNGPSMHDEMCNVYLAGYYQPLPQTHGLDMEWTLSAWKHGKLGFEDGKQVVGVSYVEKPKSSLVWVLHRGGRIWDRQTFDVFDMLRVDLRTPLESTVLLGLDPLTGKVERELGAGAFYLPHGIQVDPNPKQDALWVVDVGAHTVSKVSLAKSRGTHTEILLELGERFVPGKDSKHFCKPTDVAFSSDYSIVYVADGYCNNRVVMFDAQTGNFLSEFGTFGESDGQFFLPHAIDVKYDHNQMEDIVLVADRENSRVQAFSREGKWIQTMYSSGGKSVYGVSASRSSDRIFIATRWGFSGAVEALGMPELNPALDGQLTEFSFVSNNDYEKMRFESPMLAPHGLVVAGQNDEFIYVAQQIDHLNAGSLIRLRKKS